MHVLTPRFNILPMGKKCVKLVGEVPVLLNEPCQGRYLVLKRGEGVYPGSASVEESVFYVAAGFPKRVELSNGTLTTSDGLSLFRGFVKRGLWWELARAFNAALAIYASRCIYCTAYIEAVFKSRPRLQLGNGVVASLEKTQRGYRAVVISGPGRSDVFKWAVETLFRISTHIHEVTLGATVDAPLSLYLPPARPAPAGERTGAGKRQLIAAPLRTLSAPKISAV
ncbi:hypothetical protein [Pyrobaculum ferrireducens]|uniref:Uncharacterized protein n=1 Tax=Pyrobaculum ferrireducens TaxID=1104324 RepID=G7VCK3_9CREN|nr:hypothetical protein [Pyrobaculum ferrireducens]AET33808.1 hypothetical protein P186_2422 [Pyrobaculum ferrireducens]